MLLKKKGQSFVGLLIAVLIIGILISIMLPKYQKTIETQHSQQKQTIDNVRKTLKQAEKASAQRANWDAENL